jgi:hypothetical protein
VSDAPHCSSTGDRNYGIILRTASGFQLALGNEMCHQLSLVEKFGTVMIFDVVSRTDHEMSSRMIRRNL